MARLRNVGRQAAAADDLISLKDLNAALQALPGQYIQVSRLNQPLGVPQLDNNARITNTYLPTDIARTTLTATGKVKGGQLEATGTGVFGGGVSADSLALTNGATVGTTLVAQGKISSVANIEAGTDVKGATLTATTSMAVPENTSPTFKAKAVTVDSIQLVGGGLASTTLSSTVGDITSAARLVATTAIVGGTDISAANDVVAGRDLVAIASVRGVDGVFTGDLGSATFHTSGLSTLGSLDVVDTLDVGGAMTAAGLALSGNLSKVGGGAVPIPAGVASTGPLTGSTITGTGLVKGVGLESTSTLKVAGAVTGVTTLAASDNITISGAGKKLITPDINTDTILATGNIHAGSGMAATGIHMYWNNRYLRQNVNRFEIAIGGTKWVPNRATSTCYLRTPDWSGSAGQDLPYAAWTTVQFSVTGSIQSDVFQYVGNGMRCLVAGDYMFTAKVNCAIMSGCQFGMRFLIDGVVQGHTSTDSRAGGIVPDQWNNISIQNTAIMPVGLNGVVTCQVYQASIASNNSTWGSDVVSDGVRQSNFYGTFLGNP